MRLGQKFRQLAREKGLLEEEPDQAVKVKLPEDPSTWPPEQSDLKKAYDGALAAVKAAVEIDPAWKKHLALLLQSSAEGDPEENDLEPFERFKEFRFAIDLPPFSEKPPVKKPEPTADETLQPPKDPSSDVSTENVDVTTPTTPDTPPKN